MMPLGFPYRQRSVHHFGKVKDSERLARVGQALQSSDFHDLFDASVQNAGAHARPKVAVTACSKRASWVQRAEVDGAEAAAFQSGNGASLTANCIIVPA